MKRRILVATGLVATAMVLVGIVAATITRTLVSASAADELVRQAEVASMQIEDDLERFSVRPDAGVRSSIARYRVDLNRSLNRARDVAGFDAVSARISVGARDVPIGGDQVLIDAVSPMTPRGEPVGLDVAGTPMFVVVEDVDVGFGTLTVAVGQEQPAIDAGTVAIPVVVAVVAGALLAVGLGIWFSNTTARRLQRLAEAATAVGAGDLGTRVDVGGDDEIAALAGAIDTMAEQLDDARRREQKFLMSVGHDLRTPLTTIRGYAESLHSQSMNSDELAIVGTVLDRQTRALDRLIDDLMTLARLDAGEFTLDEELTDVGAVVAEIAAGYVRRAAEDDITIETNLDEVEAVLDQDRVAQIVGNLLENALRHTPSHGSIEVTCVGVDGLCTISVGNAGPGIEPADIDRVFDRHYVAERDRAIRPAGSGLGLAIVAELVDAMGGSVTCHSIPNTWTTMTVVL